MSLHPKIARQLEERMKMLPAKGIDLWDKVVNLISVFGKEELTQDTTIETYELFFVIFSSVCRLAINEDILDQKRTITIYLADYEHKHSQLVFKMIESQHEPFTKERQDPRVSYFNEKCYEVEVYIPGDWEKRLDEETIKNGIALLRNKNQEMDEKFRETLPLSENDKLIAQNFALEIE